MIVGLMLMRMPPEDAFWLLVATIENYLYNYFSPHLSQLRQDALVFTDLLAKHARQVSSHFNALGIEPLTYITQWFMPLYTVTLPWRSVLRVWDMLYCDGVKTLHRVAIGLLAFSKGILAMHITTHALNLFNEIYRPPFETMHVNSRSNLVPRPHSKRAHFPRRAHQIRFKN